MDIQWFRDLAVCILGFGATLVIIFMGILVLLLYRRLKPILDSAKAAAKTVENISSCVEEEVARPLGQVAAFVQGIRQAFNMFGKFSRGKEGGEND